MQKLLLPLNAFLLPFTMFAQSTGFLPPSSAVAPMGFTNPTEAFVSDDVWASVAHQSGCRCPFLYLSWDGGTTYSTTQLLGPFGTTDQTAVAGSPSDTWGHTWTDVELNNTNFRLKIANPSTLIEQGYADFNFNIPANSTINGIEVKLEWHGDANFTIEFLDQALVNVYYTLSTGETAHTAAGLLSIYPNPAKDKITVDLMGRQLMGFLLFDAMGRSIPVAVTNLNGSSTLDLSSLPRGLYFIRVVTESGTENKKIVLE
jgi:hypothetical protein